MPNSSANEVDSVPTPADRAEHELRALALRCRDHGYFETAEAVEKGLDALLVALRSAEQRAAGDQLREALSVAAKVAHQLMGMIDRETWRAQGGDDQQGHYEGDYYAAQVEQMIVEWSALAALEEPTP